MTHDLETLTEEYAPPTEHHEHNGDAGTAGGDRGTVSRARSRRWPWLAVGLVIGTGATLAASRWGGDADGSDQLVEESVQLTTVEVSTQDLVEEVEWAGTLSSGLTIEIASPAEGVVTAAPATGETIERGDVVVRIDALPVVALYGDIPMWRDLAVGDEGDDVRQLEANLVHLGYDPDGAVTIDGEFTSATASMVERWEEDLGLDATGDVPVSRIVVVPGPTEIVDEVVIGATVQAGSPLVTVDAAATRMDVVGWETAADTDGELDAVAEVGTPVDHGTVLYTADGTDAVAVVESDPVTEAVLDAMSTGDVEWLESVLAFVGFDPEGLLVVDDEADLQTVAAIVRWQESVGLPATGSADPSHYVVVPGAADAPHTVGVAHLEAGDRLGNGAVVMELERPTLTVTADVSIAEVDEFEVGDTVTVEQLDESTFEARVASVADVADQAEGEDADPTVSVEFDVVTDPEEFVSGVVTITSESSRIDGAMVVPSRALVALREGGYAVERRLADGTSELVGVEIGTFDDGMVEIVAVTTGELAVGDDVVVPT